MKVLVQLNDRNCLSVIAPTQVLSYPNLHQLILWVDSQDSIVIYNMSDAEINAVVQQLYNEGKADLTAWEAEYNVI